MYCENRHRVSRHCCLVCSPSLSYSIFSPFFSPLRRFRDCDGGGEEARFVNTLPSSHNTVSFFPLPNFSPFPPAVSHISLFAERAKKVFLPFPRRLSRMERRKGGDIPLNTNVGYIVRYAHSGGKKQNDSARLWLPDPLTHPV